MSNSILAFVLLENPVAPDMSAVAKALRMRHPELRMRGSSDDGQQIDENSPLIRCGNELVAVMSMPGPIPHDPQLWSRAADTWPQAKAVAAQHRGHVIVSMLGQKQGPLTAARVTTAVIGALIAATPECSAVVFDGQVARPAQLWQEASLQSFAPFPDYPFSLWTDILPFRSGEKIGAITTGLSRFAGREIEFETGKLTLPMLLHKVAGLAAYLIEHGDVVKDGDTIGASEKERFAVRHKKSDVFNGLPVLFCSDDLA